MAGESQVTILGCGTSTGVPVISCNCKVCLSAEPKNNRTRSSLHIKTPEISVVIDTGPDLRQQLLREGITYADAILYTHGHVDHTAGLDEARAFCWQRDDRLPLYGSSDTLEILERMFPWGFDDKVYQRGYIRARGVEFSGIFTLGDLVVTPFEVVHASIATHGFHILFPSGNSLAYACDMKSLPGVSYDLLKSCDVHIFDGLRPNSHPSHMTSGEACELADKLGSPCTYLTHLSHEIDYELFSATLPENRHLAYDGLTLSI